MARGLVEKGDAPDTGVDSYLTVAALGAAAVAVGVGGAGRA